MSQCKVWLDNYSGQYYPGSQIQGKVILNFNSETKIRGVKIRIVCQEHTEWMGTESYIDPATNENRSRDTLFNGDNEAFTTEILLYGDHSGNSSLPMGQHIYPFSLSLPNILPSTYHGEHGCISYQLIAIVDRPMALDYEDKLIFIVVAPVDLNMLRRPELLEPSSYSEDKTVCCLCCAQGPISLDVELPKRTLVPGETVNITARLTNMSNTNIDGVNFSLKQIITCRVNSPSSDDRVIDNVLVDLNEVGLGAHGEHTYTFPVMLPINVPIPNFSLCKLFKVEYRYKVIAKIPGVHSNLEVVMFPEIGNIQMGQGPGQTGGYQVPMNTDPIQGGYQYPPAGGDGYHPVPTAPGGYSPYPTPSGGQYPAPGGQYPIAGAQYPVPGAQYPPPGGQYPPPSGFTPPVGGVSVYPPSVPSSAPTGYSKAQEAGEPNRPTNSEQPPPTYDSLNYK